MTRPEADCTETVQHLFFSFGIVTENKSFQCAEEVAECNGSSDVKDEGTSVSKFLINCYTTFSSLKFLTF